MSEETIPQMRDRIKELEKQVGDKDTALAKAVSTNRVLTAREAFRTQGYDPAQGELFAASTDGDITADSINEFATKFNLQPAASGETTEDSGPAEEDNSGTTDDKSGLQTMSGGSSQSGTGGQQAPGTQTMTRQDYNSLQQSDPVAARQAILEGRVQLRADNPLAVQR